METLLLKIYNIKKIILGILINIYTVCQAWQFDFNMALPKLKPPTDKQIEHNYQKRIYEANNGIIFNKNITITRKKNEKYNNSNKHGNHRHK